jgi:glutamate-1-semialdehyde 2,1-aminomutase
VTADADSSLSTKLFAILKGIMVVKTDTASQISEAYVKKTPTSAERHQQALKTFPDGVTHVSRFLKPHPLYVDRAQGSRKWDIDGNEYVDYFGGHGALILGHAHPAVVEAVTRQVPRGTHYGSQHELELEWAELIRAMIPSAEKVRLVGSGTEATHMALRLARAHTGKPKFIRFGAHFHGWHDHVAFTSAPPEVNEPVGIPSSVVEQVIVLPPNDIEAVKQVLARRDDVAALILEPTGSGFGHVPTGGEFLSQLRDLTAEHGVLLIFDEVVTGFRVSAGGAQGHYKIMPDLTTLAKIVAGGYPGAVVAGRADVIDLLKFVDAGEGISPPRFPHQGTFNGYPVGAAAGITTLKLLQTGDYIARANETAERIRNGIDEILKKHGAPWCAYGEFSGVHIFTNPERQSVSREDIYTGKVPWKVLAKATPAELGHRLRLAMILGGVDITGWPGGVVSGVHTGEDVDVTLSAFEQAVEMLAEEGEFD